jgi:DNA ligase-1
VSERTLVKALSLWRGLPKTVLACRLKDEWPPTVAGYRKLFSHDFESLDSSQPYPFHQTTILNQDAAALGNAVTLGDVNEWLVVWHRKGVRAQLIKREGSVFIWSEEQGLLSGTFPELCDEAIVFPDGTVVDGVIMAWKGDAPMTVNDLKRRMKRKRVTRQLLQEIPVRYWVDDLLEEHGQDVRAQGLSERHARLCRLFTDIEREAIRLPHPVEAASWEALGALRNKARLQGADGLLLKRAGSSYCSGRMQEYWQIWQTDPFTIHAVLLYVQRRYTSVGQRTLEGTFGVWKGEHLIPVAKTESGLSEEEMYEIEVFAKEHTIDRFGPVRSLTPELVFTIAFDDVYPSSRHKSGLIVQNPRVVCRQHECAAQDAGTLEAIQQHIRH